MAEQKGNEESLWISVFIPNVRVLTEREIAELPEEKRKAAGKAALEGTWLRVLCPDKSCLKKGGKISLGAAGVEKEHKGLWLDIFCPEGYCVYKTGTEIP